MSDLLSCVLFEWLIGFVMVSCDLNFEMIGFICDYFVGFGVVSELFYNVECMKVSLYVMIGLCDCGGVVLLGYIDVVLVDG